MAVNPEMITCTADTWVLVATGVTKGTIYKKSTIPYVYVQTIRLTGEAAPTDDTEAVKIFCGDCCSQEISSDAAIDVYVKAMTRDGEVRVDL